MKIVFASGKGGTGKTTVVTNLALVWHKIGRRVFVLDCDVEEPNCHLFLKPTIERKISVTVPMPSIDSDKCTFCGACGRLCQFGAIVCLDNEVLTFPELCHSCGGCTLICPEEAITETPREVGVIEEGYAEGIKFAHGCLHVGEARAVPIIAEAKRRSNHAGLVLLDAPPGASCPMIEAVKGNDFVVMVTEPTPFGLNDLEMAVGAVRALGLPLGIVINRADIGDDRARRYCREQGIPLLGEIPNDRRLAEAYSCGHIATKAVPHLQPVFESLAVAIEQQVVQCVN